MSDENGNGATHAVALETDTQSLPISIDERLLALEDGRQDLLKKLVATKDFIHEKVIQKINNLWGTLSALDARLAALEKKHDDRANYINILADRIAMLEAQANPSRRELAVTASSADTVHASRLRRFKLRTADGQALDQHTPYIHMVLRRRGLTVQQFAVEMGTSRRTANYWLTGMHGPKSEEQRLGLIRWLMGDPSATFELFEAWANLPANIPTGE